MVSNPGVFGTLTHMSDHRSEHFLCHLVSCFWTMEGPPAFFLSFSHYTGPALHFMVVTMPFYALLLPSDCISVYSSPLIPLFSFTAAFARIVYALRVGFVLGRVVATKARYIY